MTKTDQVFQVTMVTCASMSIIYAHHVYGYSAGGALMMALGGVIMGLSGLYSLINVDFRD